MLILKWSRSPQVSCKEGACGWGTKCWRSSQWEQYSDHESAENIVCWIFTIGFLLTNIASWFRWSCHLCGDCVLLSPTMSVFIDFIVTYQLSSSSFYSCVRYHALYEDGSLVLFLHFYIIFFMARSQNPNWLVIRCVHALC